jgi:hypothetical protein
MKLDRNINANGRGKYALLKLRKLDEFTKPDDPFQQVAKPIVEALATLERAGILDWGNTVDSEFMVIRLKDAAAEQGLREYANKAAEFDPEYAGEIAEMARRAGPNHPNCKRPD